MDTTRRKIVVALASLPLVTGMSLAAGMSAGTDYVEISPPLSPESATKVEVIEFFSYACPACNQFEPLIEPWIKKLPADVMFHRIPVVYHPQWEASAKLYFTMEVLGENARLDRLIFDAIHKQHQDFSSPAVISVFLESHGIAPQKFLDAFNSFSVETKMQRSKLVLASYKVDQVPEMAVDGRYVTSNAMFGGKNEAVLPVVDYLIGEARKLRKLPQPK
jgi:thiol:disulfide interchange protein DsbA